MSIVLHIDTAVQTSSICLSSGDNVLVTKVNPAQRDAANWLHVAIKTTLHEQGLQPHELNAIAISAGPGSYTGLRVGMSAAKGLCYALNIPLITINTLEQMAWAAGDQDKALLCPMIDARRMEVFTALFDESFDVILPATNKILDASSFSERLDQQKIFFFGNGSEKFKAVTTHQNARFGDITTTAQHMLPLVVKKLKRGEYADLAYAEPFYGKDFHSVVKES
ncbi:MAG: tRNA (adenosine(37)-N6)-threonylcarbamoyltransferase complex dimerization subunit type 1 TsaB [Flavisolibacter sp.]